MATLSIERQLPFQYLTTISGPKSFKPCARDNPPALYIVSA